MSSSEHGVVAESMNPVLCNVVGDPESLVRSALALPEATHFVAFGQRDLRKWFHPAARTREAPVIDTSEFESGKHEAVVACALDSIAREPVARFLLKATRRPKWPGAVLWHWWLCSDEEVLIAFYDWPMLAVVNRRLAEWAESLVQLGDLAYQDQEPPA